MRKGTFSPRGGGQMPVPAPSVRPRSAASGSVSLTLTEKQVVTIFNRIKKAIIKDIGHTGPTTDAELTKIGKRLFGAKYTGTFTVEHKPAKSRKLQYFIINNQRKDQPGEHWVGIVKTGTKYHIYDSFGRSSRDLIPSFVKNKKYFDLDRDAEQSESSAICGGLCLAWLICVDRLGIEKAMKI